MVVSKESSAVGRVSGLDRIPGEWNTVALLAWVFPHALDWFAGGSKTDRLKAFRVKVDRCFIV